MKTKLKLSPLYDDITRNALNEQLAAMSDKMSSNYWTGFNESVNNDKYDYDSDLPTTSHNNFTVPYTTTDGTYTPVIPHRPSPWRTAEREDTWRTVEREDIYTSPPETNQDWDQLLKRAQEMTERHEQELKDLARDKEILELKKRIEDLERVTGIKKGAPVPNDGRRLDLDL